MKVRDETFSKPKLSHPKEARNRERNRDGSYFDSGERERKQKVHVKVRVEGTWRVWNQHMLDGSIFWMWKDVLPPDKGLGSCVRDASPPRSWPLISMWGGERLQKWVWTQSLRTTQVSCTCFYTAHIIYSTLIIYNLSLFFKIALLSSSKATIHVMNSTNIRRSGPTHELFYFSYDSFCLIKLRIDRRDQNKLLLHFLGYHVDESLHRIYDLLHEKERQWWHQRLPAEYCLSCFLFCF